jgi:hypothetical protein
MSSAKRARYNERFAAIPLSVLMSESFKTMPVGFQRVLWLLAAQFDGTNNGDLALTRKMAAHFGLNNERHRTHGLRMCEERGFIVKTSQGGLHAGKGKPTLWALTWRQIEYWDGEKLDVVKLPPMTGKKKCDTHVASRTDTHVASANGEYDTHPDSTDTPFTTRTQVAPSKNLGRVHG